MEIHPYIGSAAHIWNFTIRIFRHESLYYGWTSYPPSSLHDDISKIMTFEIRQIYVTKLSRENIIAISL